MALLGSSRALVAFGLLSLTASVLLAPSASLAQSAAVSLTEGVGTNVVYVNGGGFSLLSDGALHYEGPLNAVVPVDSVDRARIVINDLVLLDGVPSAVQELVQSGESRALTLSPELVSASVELTDRTTLVLGIGGQIPSYAQLGGILEKERKVVVGGQSLSIFPDLEPSVFNRSVLP